MLFLAWLTLAGGWLVSLRFLPSAAHGAHSLQAASILTASNAPRTKSIELVQVGERVMAENPIDEPDLQFGDDVDAVNWRKLELIAPKKDGTEAEVVLLRPIEWLSQGRR